MSEENIVKRACRELGITQKELAEMLDIPQPTISRWGNNEEPPRMAKMALEQLLELKEYKEAAKKLNEALSVFLKLSETKE